VDAIESCGYEGRVVLARKALEGEGAAMAPRSPEAVVERPPDEAVIAVVQVMRGSGRAFSTCELALFEARLVAKRESAPFAG
jgi:hypothetical protein